MNREFPAHATVEVEFDNSDYLNVCVTYGGGHDYLDRWRELGDLLAHRAGWYFHVADTVEAIEPVWSAGAFGGSLINIRLGKDGRYECFDSEQDSSLTTDDLAAVQQWVDEHEERARRIPEDLRASLASEDWHLLRASVFEVRVDWTPDLFHATVKGLPEEAAFGDTIAKVLQASREMVIQRVGAPAEIAAQLRIKVRLTEAAAAEVAKA